MYFNKLLVTILIVVLFLPSIAVFAALARGIILVDSDLSYSALAGGKFCSRLGFVFYLKSICFTRNCVDSDLCSISTLVGLR